ncbi:MAG: hypothetical protein KTR22_14005 [Flavobacteriaceae bacterium]|nr:hypothetical protein [Flavobacteriaceae bacterium]
MMEVSITQVPLWISISFAILMLTVPAWLIAQTTKNALAASGNPSVMVIRNRVLLFYFLFFVVIAIISLSGFFMKNTLPPRVIIFAAIPLFLFYVIFVQRRPWFKTAFEHVTLEGLIQIHLFRFVGIFFFLLYAEDALPKTFAYIGGAGDVLTALFAIPTLYFLKKKAKLAKTLVWAWNIFGLMDILSVLTTAIITTQLAITNNEPGVQQFGSFPFSWIPTFAPATIIFLHLLIFRKLTSKK